MGHGSEYYADLPLNDPRWLAFIEGERAGATAFHHPRWAALLAECYGYRPFVAATLDGDHVTAGLAMLEVRSALTGHRWVGLPFTDHSPLLAQDEAAAVRLTDGLVELRRHREAPRMAVHGMLPERTGVQLHCSAVIHSLPLSTDADAVFRTFKKTQVRQRIARAEREGLIVHRAQSRADLATFYRLHVETRRRLGTPVQPRRFFDLLWDRLIEPGHGFALSVYQGPIPIASAIFLEWNGTLIYKYSASDPDYWQLRPNNLLLWSAIRWGCEHGCHLFDFGKTELANAGLRDFKRGWGTIEAPLVYASVGTEQSPRSDGRASQLLGSLIRNTPPVVGRAVGELLYRHVA